MRPPRPCDSASRTPQRRLPEPIEPLRERLERLVVVPAIGPATTVSAFASRLLDLRRSGTAIRPSSTRTSSFGFGVISSGQDAVDLRARHDVEHARAWLLEPRERAQVRTIARDSSAARPWRQQQLLHDRRLQLLGTTLSSGRSGIAPSSNAPLPCAGDLVEQTG